MEDHLVNVYQLILGARQTADQNAQWILIVLLIKLAWEKDVGTLVQVLVVPMLNARFLIMFLFVHVSMAIREIPSAVALLPLLNHVRILKEN